MRKLTKAQIADKFTNELKHFDVSHPHTLTTIHKWLTSKWNPAIDDRIAVPLDWSHWKTSAAEWTPRGFKHIVILSYASGKFRIFIAGKEYYSDIIQQCWQDRLSHFRQDEISEIIGATSLFELSDYEVKESEPTIYTHEDG